MGKVSAPPGVTTANVNGGPSSGRTQWDHEVNSLHNQIQTHTLRTSQYKNRLLATLDTLDAMQVAHKRELESLHNTISLLTTKVSRYASLLKSAEAERDEMKEGFAILVEKVEQSQRKFKGWPYSRMQMSSAVEPIRTSHRGRECDHLSLLSFAAAMLTAVRTALTREEKEHAYTKHIAESRIISLEAQLSRRKADIEEYITRPSQGGNTRRKASPSRREQVRHLSESDHEDVREQAAKENMVLEREVLRLEQELKDATLDPQGTAPNLPPIIDIFQNSSLNLNFELAVTSTPRATPSEVPIATHHPTVTRPPSFNDQIQELGKQVSTFQDERNRVQVMIDESKRHPNEHVRSNVPSSSKYRDTAAQTSPPPTSPPPPPPIPAIEDEDKTIRPFDANLLDTDDEETSMELATPLNPSMLALQSLDFDPNIDDTPSMTEDDGHSSYIDPPSIPLPPSPPPPPPG